MISYEQAEKIMRDHRWKLGLNSRRQMTCISAWNQKDQETLAKECMEVMDANLKLDFMEMVENDAISHDIYYHLEERIQDTFNLVMTGKAEEDMDAGLSA